MGLKYIHFTIILILIILVSLPVRTGALSAPDLKQVELLQKDTKLFYKCKGEDTAASSYTQNNLLVITDCITGITKPKYCQYKCIVQKMGYLDKNGNPNFPQVEKDMKRENFFKGETDNMIAAAKECAENNKNYASEDNKCRNMREFYYCFHNKYLEVCQTKDVKTKDIDNPSAEVGVINNAILVAGTAAGAAVNKL